MIIGAEMADIINENVPSDFVRKTIFTALDLPITSVTLLIAIIEILYFL